MSSPSSAAQQSAVLNRLSLRMLGLLLGILQCTALSANSDIVINEIVAGASDRRLQWDANGVPHLGSGTPWQANSFNDSSWQTGPGPFGFGSYASGSVTYGTDLTTSMLDFTPSVYLRKSFTVSATDAARTDHVKLVINYNDGFVCYLNGVEVARRWAGPPNQFQYHDQPAVNPDLNNVSIDTDPTTLYSETIDLGAANTRLISGNNVIAIQGLNWDTTSENLDIDASLTIPSVVTFVNSTDTWKYLPGVVEPSGGNYDPTQLNNGRLNVPWGQSIFDDSNWIFGAGPLSVNNGGRTPASLPAVIGQTPSVYMRYVFNVTPAQAADTQPLKLLVDYDDAFVAYLNGVEVARANISTPNTFIPHTAVADSTHNNSGQVTYIIDPPSKALLAGDNVLAIQVHNVAINDSDLYLKADLTTNDGTPLVTNTQSGRFFVGTQEPVAGSVSDGEDTASANGPSYHSDWIELFNNGGSDVSLNGWSLTDSAGTPAKWVFPSVTIPTGGYLVVFCDGLDITTNPGGNLHTNFSLSSSGEYLALHDQTGALVQEFNPGFPKASMFYSYGRNTNGDYVYFDTATPGAPNSGNQATGFVANPTFSISSGFYPSSQSVSLSCATPGATIRYTTDGSEPTATTGTLYNTDITVAANTPIRAHAFATGLIPSDTITNTYLINESALHQSLPAILLNGDQTRSLYRPYGVMAIVNNASANYNNGNKIWTATGDPTQYNNPNVEGDPMERPASVELLYPGTPPTGSSNFKTDLALRISGSTYVRPRYVLTAQNAASHPNNGNWQQTKSTEKPSFNFYFKNDYGVSPLITPLFPNSPITSFDSIRMRAGHNDVNPFVLDELVRRNYVAMGQVGSVGFLNTLYVDGLYKGYFNLCEHLREPFFQAAYNSTNEWDVKQRDAIASGDGLSIQEMVTYVRNNPQNVLANYEGMQTRLDMTNFCDYLLVNVVAGTQDWPTNNFVIAHERVPGALHRFYEWDAEGSFGRYAGKVTSNSFTTIPQPLITATPQTDPLRNTIQILYTLLKPSPEFRLLFADRIQKHMFNNGALVESNILARFNPLAAQIQPFISGFMDLVTPWLNGTSTTPTRRQVLFGYTDSNNHFQQGHFVGEGLWPATAAPNFSQYGGAISSGYQLTITNPNSGGTIYYTLDGSDPRVAGGAIHGTSYSAPITLTQTTNVKARILNGTDWSPVIDVVFTVSQAPNIQLTEIMYHPPDQGTTEGSAFEFLEFKNPSTSTSSVNMSGMTISGGVTFTFPTGVTLAPGAFALVVKDQANFTANYPNVPPSIIAGTYTGSLSNSSDTVTLKDISGNIIVTTTYQDHSPWPSLPDGYGNSLVPVDPNANPDPTNAANWRASTQLGGSPGQDDPAPTTPNVVVNEILTNSVAPQTDTVELYNPTSQPADISGWFLSDSSTTPKKFQIPSGTIIGANGYLVYTEANFNPTPGVGNSFAFDSHGEEVRLSAADSSGNLTGYSDGFSFGAANPGVSFGRYVNNESPARVSYPAQKSQTFGAANSGPLVGPVVMTELMYHPVSGDEFIELRNISNTTVPLYDPANPANHWQFGNGITYTFPAGVSLAPGQIILLTQSGNRPAGTPAVISVFGPYTGKLDNSGERVTLQMPGVPYVDPNTMQTVVPYIDVDSLHYQPSAPWPTSPDGNGPSLERLNQYAYADDATNWAASSANGGSPGSLPPISFATWQSYRFTAAQLADPTISGPLADPDGDGISNLMEYFFDTDPLSPNAGSGIKSYLATDGGTGPYLTIQFRHNLAATNISYFGDTSADLTNWNLGASVQISGTVNNGDGTETITLRDTVPVSGAARRFMRLRLNGN